MTDRPKPSPVEGVAGPPPANVGTRRTGSIALSTLLLLMVLDILADARTGGMSAHLIAESIAMLLGGIGIALLWREWLRERWAAKAARLELGRAHEAELQWRDEAARWRQESQVLLQGLGEAIGKQFDAWSLTRAEKEVGLLLLKGLSHREIASVREASEATVRQQAQAVYEKAGVHGRAELSAFFLEDLLLPPSVMAQAER